MFIIANDGDDISKLKSFSFDEIYEHLDDGNIIYNIKTKEKYELNNLDTILKFKLYRHHNILLNFLIKNNYTELINIFSGNNNDKCKYIFHYAIKNGDVELSTETPFQTKPGFVEKRIQQMIHIGADQEYEKYSEGMSDDDIQRWKHGFVCGANYAIGNN